MTQTMYPNSFTKEQVDLIAHGLTFRRLLLEDKYKGEWDLVRLGEIGTLAGQVGDGTGSGIKCDVPHCNYEDHDVDPEEMIFWVNKPCPCCGANLLTEADMIASSNMYIKMFKANQFANKWAPRIPHFIRKFIFKKPTAAIISSQNGTGKVKLEVKDVSTES